MQLAANNTPQEKKLPRSRVASTAERRRKEFNEAVERVYRIYGNDLSAFLRNIQREKELVKKG